MKIFFVILMVSYLTIILYNRWFIQIELNINFSKNKKIFQGSLSEIPCRCFCTASTKLGYSHLESKSKAESLLLSVHLSVCLSSCRPTTHNLQKFMQSSFVLCRIRKPNLNLATASLWEQKHRGRLGV